MNMKLHSNSANSKTKTFTFKYDPYLTPEGMFTDFWQAVDGKQCLSKPHQISSPHIEVLLDSINKNRWEIFNTLVVKKPNSLTELAKLLNKDYGNVWRDVRILEGMGIIKLQKEGTEVKPIALYERIVFDLSAERIISVASTKTHPTLNH